jgi:hypothetical protein
VLPTDNLFASDRNPSFHIDPFLLDAAGQVVGYWPVEYLSEGYVALPIRIAKLTRYRDNLPPGTGVQCITRIDDVTRRQLKGNFDVVAPDGSLWLRVQGWEDWRFYWERHIHEFWRFAKRAANGVSISLPGVQEHGIVCQRIAPMMEMDKTGLWEILWMHMILNRRELQEYQGIGNDEKRAAWIFERACAKDALRAWIRRRHSLDICPADIDLSGSTTGRITADGHWREHVPENLHVSVCYAAKTGVGAAGAHPLQVAVIAADDDGELQWLTAEDRKMLRRTGASGNIDRHVVCARQAAARLLASAGSAADEPVAVTRIDTTTGRVDFAGSRTIAAHTVADGNRIIAVAVFGNGEWNN